MARASVHTLSDWPEDRLPNCSLPDCRREIANGERYVVPPGSILMLCYPCARDEQKQQQAAVRAQAMEEAQLPKTEQHKRRMARGERKPLGRPRTNRPPRGSERNENEARLPKRVHAPHRRGEPVSCPVCEQAFAPLFYGRTRGYQKYCSPTCANRARWGTVKIPCPQCGTPFMPLSHGAKVGRQKFCSPACAYQHKTTSIQPVLCGPCGRTFLNLNARPGRPRQYCSKSCRWYGLRGRPNPHPPVLRWTGKHEQCIHCGRSDRRHRGRGLCGACYRAWQEKRIEIGRGSEVQGGQTLQTGGCS